MGESKGFWSRGGNFCNGGRSDQPNSWKSPQSSDLALEKEFCKYLSSIPWGRLCHAQKYIYIYKSILQWDDSGALESFRAARSRFNAEFTDEPCDNPLPDPDMYIDQIDHDCIIDPELIADIEKELEPPESTKEKHQTSAGKSGWDSVECTDRCVPVTGWESWSDDKDKKDNSNNWDAYLENKPDDCKGWGNCNWYDDPWERGNNKATGWGNDGVPSSSAWDRKDDSNNDGWNNDRWNNSWNNSSWYQRRNEAYSRNGRKRDGSVGNGGFKVRKVRYKGENCQPGNNWRGLRGRNNRSSPYNAAFS